jgi:hypothetical protein
MHLRISHAILPVAAILLCAPASRAHAQTAAPTPAAAPQSEFARRAGHGSGFYITRERIDRAHPEHTLDLLRGAPGLEVRGNDVRVRQGTSAVPTSRNRFGTGGGGSAASGCPAGVESAGCGGDAAPGRTTECAPTVFVDGTIAPAGAGELNAIAPAELEGIEVYSRANTAPAQYRRNTDACAIILVWKRQAPAAAVLPQAQ